MLIPKIKRIPHHWNYGGCKWMVIGKHGTDFVPTFKKAIRYWLYNAGVSPDIAFGWFRKD